MRFNMEHKETAVLLFFLYLFSFFTSLREEITKNAHLCYFRGSPPLTFSLTSGSQPGAERRNMVASNNNLKIGEYFIQQGKNSRISH